MAANKKYISSKEIVEMYLKGYSTPQISEALGLSVMAVIRRLRKEHIETRSLEESQWNLKKKVYPEDFKNYDIMYQKYVVEKKSKKDLSIEYNCDPCVIDRVLRKLGIHIRNNSEAKRLIAKSGKNHPNWQGGKTLFCARVREYTQKEYFFSRVFKRDGCRCVICGCSNYSKLQVHHILSFKKIIDQILEENLNLTIENNKEELYQIAIKHPLINSIGNLVTVCSDCHHKIHKGDPRNRKS